MPHYPEICEPCSPFSMCGRLGAAAFSSHLPLRNIAWRYAGGREHHILEVFPLGPLQRFDIVNNEADAPTGNRRLAYCSEHVILQPLSPDRHHACAVCGKHLVSADNAT